MATLKETVKNQPALLDQLFHTSAIGVQFGEGFDGDFLYMNDAFLAMLGYTRAEFEEGKFSWKDLTPPEALKDEGVTERLQTSGEVKAFRKQYFHKDGHRVDVVINVFLIPGSKTEWICYVLDVSPKSELRKLMEEALVTC